MVKLDRIYTRGGDKGETSLGTGERVAKYSLRVAAYGTIDEGNAVIGIVRLYTQQQHDVDQMLFRIQNDLFDLGADLCTPEQEEEKRERLRIVEGQVARLEKEIDFLNQGLEEVRSFVLPGGTEAAAYLHLARTVIRRAERLITQLATQEKVSQVALRYINRLSDHLFVVCRYLNRREGGDVLWVPGVNRDY